MIPKRVFLGSNSIGDEGCFYISEVIDNTGIDLEEIDLSRNTSIGLSGLQSILTSLARKGRPPLEKLDLSFIPFGDAGISAIVDAFLNRPDATPKYLRLRYCRVYNGYREICRLLQCPDCSLKKIDLRNNSHLRAGVSDQLLDSLRNNAALETMHLSKIRSGNLWDRLQSLVCNTASISSTYSSNHSLVCFGDCQNQPPKVKILLEMNKHPDKKAIAEFKVVDNHFAQNFNIISLEGMGAPLLAEVIAFVNRGFALREEDILGMRKNSSSGNGDSSSNSHGGDGCRENNNITINFIIARNMPALFGFIKL